MQHNRDLHNLYCPFVSYGSITGNFMTSWTSIFYWRKAVPHAWRESAASGNKSWHFIHICATKGLASYTSSPLHDLPAHAHASRHSAPLLRCISEKKTEISYLITRKYESPSLYILWCIYPLLGNDSVNTFPLKRTRAIIWRPLLRNGPVNTLP
jgi:hypothetical protein